MQKHLPFPEVAIMLPGVVELSKIISLNLFFKWKHFISIF